MGNGNGRATEKGAGCKAAARFTQRKRGNIERVRTCLAGENNGGNITKTTLKKQRKQQQRNPIKNIRRKGKENVDPLLPPPPHPHLTEHEKKRS